MTIHEALEETSDDHSVELPFAISRSARLYLWPYGEAAMSRFRAALSSVERDVRLDPEVERIEVDVDPSRFLETLAALRTRLSSEELHDARVLLKADASPPTLADFSRADRLAYFIAISRGQWLNEILRQDRLAVAFQPIVDAQTLDRIDGFEALLRGVDRNRSLIAPDRLLSAARDAALLPQLDHQLHHLAARTVVLSDPGQRLFINTTPTTACHRELGLDALRDALSRYDLEPRRVVIELTESEEAPDARRLRSIAAQARECGFALALDDLGAGFSNLNLIHELEPDIIKLDMALVRDIHRDRVKAAIAEMMVDLAKELGITIIAEGIEQIEELAWVRARGIELAQGFLLGRPQAAPASGESFRLRDPYEDVETQAIERLR